MKKHPNTEPYKPTLIYKIAAKNSLKMTDTIQIKLRKDGTRYFDYDGEIFNVDHRGIWVSEGLTFMGKPKISNGHLSGFMIGSEENSDAIRNGHPIFNNPWVRVTYGGGSNIIQHTSRKEVLEMYENGELIKDEMGAIVQKT